MRFAPRWIRRFAFLALVAVTLPLFAAGRDLGSRAIAPSAYGARITDVAYADDRYLAVWVEHMGSIGETIRGSLLDGTGRRISDESFPIMTTRGAFVGIGLVPVETSFVLFAGEAGGPGSMTTLNSDGEIVRRDAIDVPFSYVSTVAWNGTRFLLADGATATLLDRDGRAVAAPGTLPGQAGHVIPRGDGFLVITAVPQQLGGQLSVVLVDADGVIAMMATIDEAAGTWRRAPHPFAPVATTLPNGEILVVWGYGDPSFFGNEVRSAVVAADGNVSTRRVALPSTLGVFGPVHLVSSGDGALLMLRRDWGLSTVPLSYDGVAVTTPRLATATTGWPAVADNGTSAVAVASIPSTYYVHRPHVFSIAADGTIGNPELLALMPARQTQPAMAWGGGQLLAAWTDVEGEAAYVRGAVVSRDGEPTRHSTIAPAFFAAQGLAWNGSQYLVVHYDNGRLRATRADANGQQVGAPLVLAEVVDSIDWSRVRPVGVVWAGTHWMIIWSQAAVAWVSTVSADGVASPARKIDLRWGSDPPWQTRVLALAFDGEHALIVADNAFYDPSTTMMSTAILVSPQGEMIGQPLELPFGDPVDSAAVATSGEEFVVVARSTAVAVRKSGTFLSVGEVRALRGEGDITWDGREYVAVHRREAWHWTLEIQRLDRALNPIGEPRFTRTLPPDIVDRPSVAARASHPALIAIQEGDANGARAVVYREDAFEPLPPLPPAPVNVRRSATAEGSIEISWEAPSFGTVDAYIVEILAADGTLLLRQSVSPETRSFKTYVPSPPGPASIRVRSSNANGLSEIPVRRRAVAR